jgi:exopolyphosphatase/guanosine-5'-triphosphate,3'-diphosphate pyrophosphatase
MKLAAIDIGTNTVLLLIAHCAGAVEGILDLSTITRLGEGLNGTGVLSETAMERTLAALGRYRRVAGEEGVDEIVCLGTAALREAGNSGRFLSMAKERFGLSVRIISAREEAFYTYLSVRDPALPAEENFLVIDIGGGSTEIIRGASAEFTDFVSLPIGSVKLTEMFIHHDPPETGEIRALEAFLDKTLTLPFEGRGCPVIGTAGTMTNLASIVLGLESFDACRIEGHCIGADELDLLIRRLTAMTVAEKKAVTGMESGRADVFLQGILLLRTLLRHLEAEEITVSTKGVRYGVLYERTGLSLP